MGHILASAPAPGKPAPDFTLPQLDGPPVRLADLRGRVVVLNFWASWCAPCREETPALKAFYQRYGDRVAFYAVNVAEQEAQGNCSSHAQPSARGCAAA